MFQIIEDTGINQTTTDDNYGDSARSSGSEGDANIYYKQKEITRVIRNQNIDPFADILVKPPPSGSNLVDISSIAP